MDQINAPGDTAESAAAYWISAGEKSASVYY
jgi:hypothetical protein